MKKAIAILCVILGCSDNHSDTINKDFITVDVTMNYPKKELILQDLFDVEYIPLETTDEFVTSANIQLINKNMMIFTNRNWGSDDIFVFDRNGKGLRKINRYGQGGEEYVNIQGIVLDENEEEMYVNSTFSGRVLTYDLFGNFKRNFKIEQKENLLIDQIGNLNAENFICHNGYFHFENENIKYPNRNVFFIISKLDGSIEEIHVPYEEKISTIIFARDANGKIIDDRGMRNKELIAYKDHWIIVEPSADTIYSYTSDHVMKPFIVRKPSIQTMKPEVFLFPGVLTDRYYFMQTVKAKYDFATDNGFQRTDLMYDKENNIIFEYVVYNNDFINKKPMNLVYEIPMFTLVNNSEIVFVKRLEAFELVEAYEKGQLKGKLKEIAATLDEESNPVIMLAKYKK